MSEISNTLKILLEERDKHWATISSELVETIYQIEERFQFDEARPEAPQKLRQALQLALDKEVLKGSTNGDEV